MGFWLAICIDTPAYSLSLLPNLPAHFSIFESWAVSVAGALERVPFILRKVYMSSISLNEYIKECLLCPHHLYLYQAGSQPSKVILRSCKRLTLLRGLQVTGDCFFKY